MLKKLSMMAAVVAVSGMTAKADINILYTGSAGFYVSDPGTGIVDPSGSFLAQLIYTASGTIGFADAGTVGFVTGDNQVLDSVTVGFGVPADLAAGSTFGDFNAGVQVYPGPLEGGFVFVRIFQDTTPQGGDFYYDSPTTLTTVFTGTQSPQLIDANTDFVNGNQLTLQVVPEPSVLAFMGIGALLMAVRRRRA
jgi:hypothetical protein